MKAGDKYEDRQLGTIYTLVTWGNDGVVLDYNGRKLPLSHARLKQEFKKVEK